MAALYDSIGGRPEGAARSRAVCHAQARRRGQAGEPMSPDSKLGLNLLGFSEDWQR